MLAKISKLSLIVLLSILFSGLPHLARAESLARSGTLEIEEEGIKLDFTIGGGKITSSTNDGWESKYFIEGTARPGETLSIAVSGNGTTFSEWHHVNEDKEATLSVWFEAGDGEENRETVTLAPGEGGSLASSFVVPRDAGRVKIVGIISNVWINPTGGGSRSLILNAEFEVQDMQESDPPETAVPEATTSPREIDRDEEDCTRRAIVRFGDLHGEVNVRPNSEDDDAYIFAELSTCLHHDDRIRTLRRSGAILSFADMSTFVMKEDTTIVLDIANERESKIGLVAGNIWVNLKRLIEDGSMEVEMSQAVAGIKGTTLICEDDGTTSTVKVLEGTVEFKPNLGEPVMVSDGQMVSATSDGAGLVQTFSIPEEMATWDETTQVMTEQALKDKKGGLWGNAPLVVGIMAVVLIGYRLVHRRMTGKNSVTVANTASLCPQCQNPVSPHTRFCGKCGQKL